MLPGELDEMLADPAFWASYLLDDDFEGDRSRYEAVEELTARFAVTADYGLRIDMLHGFWYHELGLVTADAPHGHQLGWDDGAHFHPHVFRWEEFDLVCRAMALHDPSLRYPGPASALLSRFAFLSERENLDEVTPVIDACLHSTRPPALGPLGYWPGTSGWLYLKDLRGCRISWRRDSEGIWTASQSYDDHLDARLPLYTLRWAPDGETGAFPFREWKLLLEAAERTLVEAVDVGWARQPEISKRIAGVVAGDLAQGVALAGLLQEAGCRQPVVLRALREPVHPVETMWVLELLTGARRGALIAEHFGPSPFQTDFKHELVLRLSLEGEENALLPRVVDELEAELSYRGLGGAFGYTARTEQGVKKGTVTVTLRGDREEGERVVRQVLRRHPALRWELD